jgi:hypothetical protein
VSADPRILGVGEELPPMDPAPQERPPRVREPARPKGNRSSQGRFESINAFIDVTMAELPPAERAVWLILWRDTKPNGLAATSQESLARRAGVTDRAVRTALKGLQQKGLVTVVRRGGLRRGPSAYRVQPLVRGA